jgi:hypothetical protein
VKDKDQIELEKQKEKEELLLFYNEWTNKFDDFTAYAFDKFKYIRLDETWPHRILLTLLIDHIKVTRSELHYEQVKDYLTSIFNEDLFENLIKKAEVKSKTVIKLVVNNDKKKPEKNID